MKRNRNERSYQTAKSTGEWFQRRKANMRPMGMRGPFPVFPEPLWSKAP